MLVGGMLMLMLMLMLAMLYQIWGLKRFDARRQVGCGGVAAIRPQEHDDGPRRGNVFLTWA